MSNLSVQAHVNVMFMPEKTQKVCVHVRTDVCVCVHTHVRMYSMLRMPYMQVHATVCVSFVCVCMHVMCECVRERPGKPNTKRYADIPIVRTRQHCTYI